MIVRLVQLIHMMVLVFVLTGWLLPFPPWLWAHVLFIPLLVLHWRTNQNQCFLTQLEARLKESPEEFIALGSPSGNLSGNLSGHLSGGIPMPMALPEVGEGHFIKSIWKKIFGRTPSEQFLDAIIYGLMTICWALGVAHLVRLN